MIEVVLIEESTNKSIGTFQSPQIPERGSIIVMEHAVKRSSDRWIVSSITYVINKENVYVQVLCFRQVVTSDTAGDVT